MMAGADTGFGRTDLYRGSAGGTAYVVTLELLQVGAGLLCLGLCQSWGERAPRWVPAAGGRTIPRTLPILLGGAGNLLLYLIIYPVALLFGLALLSEPPSWTPIEGMNVGQRIVFSLCYAPMLLWPIALTVGLVGYWRRHRPPLRRRAAALSFRRCVFMRCPCRGLGGSCGELRPLRRHTNRL